MADLQQVNHQLQQAIQGHQQIEELLDQSQKDLESRVAERTATLVQANQELQVTLAELQTVEEALCQQNEELATSCQLVELERQRYHDLFEFAPDGYLVTDDRGNIREANCVAAALLSVPQQYLIGKPLLIFIAQEERQAFQARLSHLQSVRDWEVYLQPRDGTPFPVAIAMTLIHSSQGQPANLHWLLRDISDRKRAEAALHQQIQWQRLITEMTQRIRQSLSLDEILNTTVAEVQRFLQTDRVIIFRFKPDWSGAVVVESVAPEWTPILSTVIHDPCIGERYIEPFRQGQITAKTDVYTAGLKPCHLQLLAHFQVRANLVVPILQGENLWGLLIAHHCSATRQWQPSEIDSLQQLAAQVGIAIQQATLFEQLQIELLERQRTEAALRGSQERLQLAQSAGKIGAFEWDIGTDTMIWTVELEAIYGLAPNSFAGTYHHWIRALHPEDRVRMEQESQQAAHTGKELDSEFRILRADGSVRWILVKAQVFQDANGIPQRMVGINMDITARKQAEQKICEQATLLDVATDAILVRDLRHQISFWNKGAERLYGWPAAEAFGKDASQLLYKQFSPQMKTALKATTEQGEWQGELYKVTKSGKEIIVSSRWTLVRDEMGNPKSILTVDTDITEKKQLEAQFLRAQRLESLGTLASGIAHDLNNILTPVLTIAQLLPLKLRNLDERSQELLKTLERGAQRGADLVKQILIFARGTEGKRTPLQPEHLLLEVAQVVQRTFPKSIAVQTHIPTTPLWLLSADVTQLHQVLMNLCVNARDAMPNGGTLDISAENLFVDVMYARMHLDAHEGAHVVITLSDTGMGIPSELMDRIFDPFFTTKELGKGTGLGLSTVLGIVKSHGGFVHVFSEVDQGTQFKVYLPAMQNQTEQSLENLEQVKGNGELILLVDDEAAILDSTKIFLEDHNYRTLTASDGVEAIALYFQHQHEISAVLMDILMPTMDGLMSIRTLQKINPQVKIIATSGLASNNPSDLPSGVQIFLSKPYTAKELLNALHTLISMAD
jgi:PAS domain S-box-containing protein